MTSSQDLERGSVVDLATKIAGQTIHDLLRKLAITATGLDSELNRMELTGLKVYQEFLELKFDQSKLAQEGFLDLDENIVNSALAYIAREAIEYLIRNEHATLSEISEHLTIDVEKQENITQFIFSVIGWATLLYKPCIDGARKHLKIEKETSAVTELNVLRNVVRPFTENLIALDLTIPGSELPEELNNVSNQLGTLDVAYLNADLLHAFGIEIVWTSCLAAHLTFQKSERKLYLFGLPAFCFLHTTKKRSLIETIWERISSSETGEEYELNILAVMEEVKLSYHLLFASTRASRRRFRSQEKSRCKIAIGVTDALLQELCTKKRCGLLPPHQVSRLSFSASTDFRIFGARLSAIQEFMLTSEPKSIWYIWKDGRSLEKITTFQAVLLFGTLGVVIAMIQTILSGFQLHYAKLQVAQGVQK